MQTLKGKVAIVGGASRGAGRGIALALGDAGATVYVAARTSRGGPKPASGLSGTVEDTADQVSERGGVGIPVQTDLSDERQVAALFERVQREQGRLDLVANSAWGANVIGVWSKKFWELDGGFWRDTADTIDSYWWTSVYAARFMAGQGRGLIVHVTDNYPGKESTYRGQVLHDLGHEAINRLIQAMARDTDQTGVTVAGLNPGFMRTEAVVAYMTSEERKRRFKFHLSESVEFIGRAVAALLADADVHRKNGQLLWASALADQYGFTDLDGRIPRFEYTWPEDFAFD